MTASQPLPEAGRSNCRRARADPPGMLSASAMATALTEHMPPNHREWANMDFAKVLAWAQTVGPETTAYVHALVEMKPTGLRSALGLKRVAELYEAVLALAACAQALRFGGRSYLPIKRILSLGTRIETHAPKTPIRHGNVRGPGYFTEITDRQRKRNNVDRTHDLKTLRAQARLDGGGISRTAEDREDRRAELR